jgi:uncharacterized protein (TIGR03067 family)
LQWPVGTLKVRLLRGRQMLPARLVRRGVVMPAATLAVALAAKPVAAVSPALIDIALGAVLPIGAGKASGAGIVSASALALAQGVLNTMMWTKVKLTAVALLLVCLVGTGAGLAALHPGFARDQGSHNAAAGETPMAPTTNLPNQPKQAGATSAELLQPTGGKPNVPPGGEAPVTQARLSRACLDAINGSHSWFFRGKHFVLTGKQELPTPLVEAMVGPGRAASRIEGQWSLDDRGSLVLTGISADGKQVTKEARLKIEPAGLLRANIEKGAQYNIFSFEPTLRVEKGVTYPIYEVANWIDLEFLQGTWGYAAMEVDGRKVEDAINEARIVVEGDRFTTTGMGATYKGIVKVDAVSSPRRLDLVFTEGPEKGNTSLAIYELDGDTWKLCLTAGGKERPTEFTTRPGSGHAFEILNRQTSGDGAGALKKELALLEGEWSMVSAEHAGQVVPETMLKSWKRVARGNETTVTFAGQVMLKATFTVDTSKQPKFIDYTLADGPNKGKQQFGIYELKGDTLRFCFAAPGKDRPSDFTTKPGDDRTLSTWRTAP